MKVSYFAVTIAALTLFAGCNMAPNPQVPESDTLPSTSSEESERDSQEMNTSIEVMGEEEAMTDDTSDTMEAMIASTEPVYKAYDATEREDLHGNEPYVLFLHADWCPVCRAMDAGINADLANFPEGTKILKADYDTEDELKDEYDIRVQSTVVVIDANGEVVWQGQDPSMADLKSYIEDSLA